MIDIPVQLRKTQLGIAFFPFGDEAIDKTGSLNVNQICRARITGSKKPRSVDQLNTYWACCKVVADNLEDATKESVDFDCKVALRHIKSFRVVKGVTFIEVDSISFLRLAHLEACGYFDRAFPVLAKMIGVDVDTLIDEAKSRMG